MVNATLLTPQLQKVIDAINRKIPAERIYLLGKTNVSTGSSNIFGDDNIIHEQINEFQLLVVFPDKEDRENAVLQNVVEQTCVLLTKVSAIVVSLKLFNAWLSKGHRFIYFITANDCLVYANAGTEVANPGKYTLEDLVSKNRKEFKEWTDRADDCMYGVEGFRKAEKFRMAAFLLHQVTELTYMAIIRLKTGFRVGSHNLELMMKYASPFCGHETNVFPRNNEKERRLFKMLQKAYIHARYKDDFMITATELDLLIERVKQLRGIVDHISRQLP